MSSLSTLQQYAERGAYGDLELYASRGIFTGVVTPPSITVPLKRQYYTPLSRRRFTLVSNCRAFAIVVGDRRVIVPLTSRAYTVTRQSFFTVPSVSRSFKYGCN